MAKTDHSFGASGTRYVLTGDRITRARRPVRRDRRVHRVGPGHRVGAGKPEGTLMEKARGFHRRGRPVGHVRLITTKGEI
jgi:hypothetical protein